MTNITIRKNSLKAVICRRLIYTIYYTKLILKSYKLDSDEFDYYNNKLSKLYKDFSHYSNYTIIQTERLLSKIHKKLFF